MSRTRFLRRAAPASADIATPLIVALDAVLVVAAARSTSVGGFLENRFMRGLDIRREAVWRSAGIGLDRMVSLTLVIFLVADLMLIASVRLRRHALAGVIMLAGSNATTIMTKWLLTHVLGELKATMPSGHSTMALTSAAVIVLLTHDLVPQRPVIRRVGLFAGGSLAAFGPVAVIVLGWHKPGDAFCAMAVVAGWILAVDALLRRLDGTPLGEVLRSVPIGTQGPRAGSCVRSGPRRDVAALTSAGALAMLAAFVVLGLRMQSVTVVSCARLAVLFVLLALGGAGVAFLAARLAARLGVSEARLGGCSEQQLQ